MRKDVVNVLHSGTTNWVKDMAMVILGVFLVVLVIFIRKDGVNGPICIVAPLIWSKTSSL